MTGLSDSGPAHKALFYSSKAPTGEMSAPCFYTDIGYRPRLRKVLQWVEPNRLMETHSHAFPQGTGLFSSGGFGPTSDTGPHCGPCMRDWAGLSKVTGVMGSAPHPNVCGGGDSPTPASNSDMGWVSYN